MSTESTRSRRKEKRIPSKLCVRCGGVKPLNEFYANKGWASQSFHDAWCRECAMKYCVDRETLQEYCWYNNRKWSEELYEGAAKKARYGFCLYEIRRWSSTDKFSLQRLCAQSYQK